MLIKILLRKLKMFCNFSCFCCCLYVIYGVLLPFNYLQCLFENNAINYITIKLTNSEGFKHFILVYMETSL